MYSAVIAYNKGIDLVREVKGVFPGESMIKQKKTEEKMG